MRWDGCVTDDLKGKLLLYWPFEDDLALSISTEKSYRPRPEKVLRTPKLLFMCDESRGVRKWRTS